MKILMCVPNVSEGRDQATVDMLAGLIRSQPGVKLIDLSADKDHNRSVYSYLGEIDAVLAATKVFAAAVIGAVDMTGQHGSHPRHGALDTVPFIPVGDTTTEEAVAVARDFGRWLGERGVPVYYYEDAATRPERVNLVDVRKGEYEALPEKLKDPAWAPDEGPAEFVPKSGATQVAARFPLVAFNVNLRTDDLEIATNIAHAVRHLNGGFRFVRAIGLDLTGTGMVQVSMNLTNYTQTPIPRVMEAIRAEAARYGVSVAGAELVGPVPLGAIQEVVRYYLQIHDFSMAQTIEMNV
jgi:glutamate formiminotransferase / 5-formyltetrahydrofolate cyclo-ligase